METELWFLGPVCTGNPSVHLTGEETGPGGGDIVKRGGDTGKRGGASAGLGGDNGRRGGVIDRGDTAERGGATGGGGGATEMGRSHEELHVLTEKKTFRLKKIIIIINFPGQH